MARALKVRLYRRLVWRRHDLVIEPTTGRSGTSGWFVLTSTRPVPPSRYVALRLQLSELSEATELGLHVEGVGIGRRLAHEVRTVPSGSVVERVLFLPPGSERILVEPRNSAGAVRLASARLDEVGTWSLQVVLARYWLARQLLSPQRLPRRVANAARVLLRSGPREARRQLFTSQLLSQSRSAGRFAGARPQALTEAERDRLLEAEKAKRARAARRDLDDFLRGGTLALPAAAKPVVSIVLVLFNRAELTLQCLRSIAEHAGPDVEVVIVDNASSDATSAVLARVRGAKTIRNDTNLGFLLACNAGVAASTGEHVLLMNNDAELLPGAVAPALERLAEDPAVGVVGGPILALDGALQEAGCIVWPDGSCQGYGRGDDPQQGAYRFRRDVDFVSGAFLLTPRRVWDEVGGFDESFAPAYFEDVDYCLSVRAAGYRVAYEPRAAVVHYEYGSAASPEDARNQMRVNRTRLLEKHAPALAALPERAGESVARARAADRHQRRVLLVDDRVPFPFTGAGAPRTRAMVQALRDLGFFVTLYPKLPVEGTWDDVYRVLPPDVEVMAGHTIEDLPGFLRERRGYYEAVVVSRHHNMEAVQAMLDDEPDLLGGARLVYDAEAVSALREVEELRLRGRAVSDGEVAGRVAAEVHLARAAELVLAVSPDEAKHFASRTDARVAVLGHAVDTELTPAGFTERRGFLFVANLAAEHSPNTDGLLWFLDRVWPDLREELGEATDLVVAGRMTCSALLRRQDPGVACVGAVDDLRGVYDAARVFVAPIRFSAGIPLKVVDAAARGVPVAATDLLARQLGWRPERELLTAPVSDVDTFVEACVRLHTEEPVWTAVREAAAEVVARDYSMGRFARTLAEAIG